jgi:hypothetical protein
MVFGFRLDQNRKPVLHLAAEGASIGGQPPTDIDLSSPDAIAQAAATTAALSGDRFWLGLGTGERLNEHVVGAKWPPGLVQSLLACMCRPCLPVGRPAIRPVNSMPVVVGANSILPATLSMPRAAGCDAFSSATATLPLLLSPGGSGAELFSAAAMKRLLHTRAIAAARCI